MSQDEIKVLINQAIDAHEARFTFHAIWISVLYFAIAAGLAWLI